MFEYIMMLAEENIIIQGQVSHVLFNRQNRAEWTAVDCLEVLKHNKTVFNVMQF